MGRPLPFPTVWPSAWERTAFDPPRDGDGRTVVMHYLRSDEASVRPTAPVLAALAAAYEAQRDRVRFASPYQLCGDVAGQIGPWVAFTRTAGGFARVQRRLEAADPALAHTCTALGPSETVWCTAAEGWTLEQLLGDSADRALTGEGVVRRAAGWHLTWGATAIGDLLTRAPGQAAWEARFDWLAPVAPALALTALEAGWWPPGVRPPTRVLRSYLTDATPGVRQRASRVARHCGAPPTAAACPR